MTRSRSKKHDSATAETSTNLRITMGAGEFKAKCLQLMDQVQKRGLEITITKRGHPVCKLVRAEEKAASPFGSMKGTVLWYGDLISPIDVEWEANR